VPGACEIVLELTADEAARLRRLLGDDIELESGALELAVEDARALAHLVETAMSKRCFEPNGDLNEEGRALARLHGKLKDTPECGALRARAREGDAEAALFLGRLKLSGMLAWLFPEESASLFRQAFDAGLREAGYELSLLNACGRELGSLTQQEFVELLEEQGLAGNPWAATTLLYMPGRPLSRERFMRVLEAVEHGSAEAAEHLALLRAED
jgi:hypothetical protein